MTTTKNSTLHKMILTLFVVGAFCVGLSATAGADRYREAPTHAGKARKSTKNKRVKRMMRKFDELDRNDDRRIGPRELRAAPKRMQKRLRSANANADRFVTRREFRKAITKSFKRGHKYGKGGKYGKSGKYGKRHGDWKSKGKRGKRQGRWSRDGRRGNGAVIRDHRKGTTSMKLLPNRRLERVTARRGNVNTY